MLDQAQLRQHIELSGRHCAASIEAAISDPFNIRQNLQCKQSRRFSEFLNTDLSKLRGQAECDNWHPLTLAETAAFDFENQGRRNANRSQ
jgi:hypothetical protein